MKYKHVNYNYEVYILDVNVIYISQDDIRFYMDKKDLRDGYGGGKVVDPTRTPYSPEAIALIIEYSLYKSTFACVVDCNSPWCPVGPFVLYCYDLC